MSPEAPPAVRRFGVPFTKENAVEMSRRGVEARRRERERLIAAEKALKAVPVPTAITERIAMVERQIDHIDACMMDETDWKALDALTRAKARLVETWSLLSGHPRPPVAKLPRQPLRNTPQPIAASPQPAPTSAQPIVHQHPPDTYNQHSATLNPAPGPADKHALPGPDPSPHPLPPDPAPAAPAS